MEKHATRARNTWRLAGLLLVLVVAFGAQAAPPISRLPGREPDSKEPWDASLGKAAHLAIGRQYRVQHPTNVVFLDTVSLYNIVRRARLGDPQRLAEFVKLLRPDIYTRSRALLDQTG
ncbi:hypothetical protein [Cystobacter ferrugineus]|nr:hypothetical protein [Cystobacter ferrugineus]